MSPLALSIFEFAAVILIIIAFFNEKKFIAFEDKLGAALGRGLRRIVKKFRS